MDTKKYVVPLDADVEDTDLDKEPITLPSGKVLDEAESEKLGREVADRAAERRPGRPSLTGRAQHSPQLATRVSPETRTKLQSIAEREGLRQSEVVRRAVEEYVANHSG